MPLAKGCSQKALETNYRILRSEGYGHQQAVAIMLSEARRTGHGACRTRLGKKPGRAAGSTRRQLVGHVQRPQKSLCWVDSDGYVLCKPIGGGRRTRIGRIERRRGYNYFVDGQGRVFEKKRPRWTTAR